MGIQLLPQIKGHISQFSAHICCGQMAVWIKMPLGREVGLGPSAIVLAGDPAPPSQKGPEPAIFGPCLLRPNRWMDQDDTWHGSGLQSRPYCARWGSSSPSPKGAHSLPQFLSYVRCGQTAGCTKMPLGMKVCLGSGDFVLDGDLAPPQRAQPDHQIFGLYLLWPNGWKDKDATW